MLPSFHLYYVTDPVGVFGKPSALVSSLSQLLPHVHT